MATANYLMEYCLIPNMLEEVKAGRNTIQSLIDIEWMKVNLERNVTGGTAPL